MNADPHHRLLLMRHAKAAYPDDCTDHERPLAGRGRTDAADAGAWLRKADWVPDLVVCSDALRTRETAELVVGGLGVQVPVRAVPELYEADIDDVLSVVAATDESVRTLLVIGHEPTMSATTGSVCGKFARFSTAAVAQIDLEGKWGSVVPGAGRLVSVHSPKD